MQREQQSAAEEHTAGLRTRRIRFDERHLNSIDQFATARKEILSLPRENQFKTNQLFLEQKSNHNCSFFAINPTLSYEWTAVNCSRRTDNVNFICEYKWKDVLHLDKKSLVVESKCPFRMVLINNHCYLISQYTQDLYVQVSQTPGYINESNFVLQRYLTAWTLSRMVDHNDESKHITIIHKNTKNFLNPCGCWQTDTLFFWELKKWHAFACPCANNVAKFQLTIVSPITSKNTTCRADVYRQCRNGSCILNIYQCEDRDGSVCDTDNSALMCATGECLWISQICDGISDCEDSSDELSCRSEKSFLPLQISIRSSVLINGHVVTYTAILAFQMIRYVYMSDLPVNTKHYTVKTLSIYATVDIISVLLCINVEIPIVFHHIWYVMVWLTALTRKMKLIVHH